MVAVLVAIATVSLFLPWFLLACVPMGITYYTIMQIYIPTSRELKRLDSILRSPIFSHFGETLEGVSIIRAFRAERQFVDASMAKLEKNLRSYYANVSSNRWLAVRLEAIGTGFVVMAALLAVLRSGNGLSAGEGGLALTYALNITQVLNWFVRMSSDREAQIVAVERVVEYGAVEGEAPAVVAECEPARDWPQQGRISFENTAMRYRPGLPLVLKGLNREILPREKVGVVGRTGAWQVEPAPRAPAARGARARAQRAARQAGRGRRERARDGPRPPPEPREHHSPGPRALHGRRALQPGPL